MPRLAIQPLLAATLLALAASGHTASADDPAHDFLSSYTGAQGGDLDVLSALVTYDPNNDSFVFSGTFDAQVGTTPGAFYVFGVNRGNGSANFAGIGATNVLFDAVVIFNQDGSGTVNRLPGSAGAGATALPMGTALTVGPTIIGQISGSLLPSNGWAKTDYTWNLWPRITGIAGGASVSDFAPDNSNLGVTVLSAVPEPGTWAMLAGGLALLGVAARRQRPQAGA